MTGTSFSLQMFCRTDAGEHEKFGRADGARRHDHFACRVDALELPAGDDFNANGAAFLDEKAVDEEIGSHREIGTFHHGSQIADSGAAAPAVPGGGLIEAGTFQLARIEIGIVGHAEIHAALDIGLGDPIGAGGSGNAKRAVNAVFAAAQARIAFRLHEIGLEVLPAPALAIQLRGPVVVIFGATAGVDFGIDGTAAAQHPGLGIDGDAVVGVAQGRCLIAPDERPAGHFEKANGHVNEGIGIARACLDQQDLCIGHFGQPCGQHAARRTAPHDDVVVTAHLQFPCSWATYK